MSASKLYVLCCDEDGIESDSIHLHGPEGRIELPYVEYDDIVSGPQGDMLPVSSSFGEKDGGIFIKLATSDRRSRVTPYFVSKDLVYTEDILQELASDHC